MFVLFFSLLAFRSATADDICSNLLTFESRQIAEHLLLTDDQFSDVLTVLRELREIVKPEAFIFTGSRTHKLWRSGFDIDIAFVGGKNSPTDNFENLKRQFLEKHRIRIDFVSAFSARKTLKSLLNGGFLISLEKERQILEITLKIWGRMVEVEKKMDDIHRQIQAGGLSFDSTIFDRERELRRWALEPISDLQFKETALRMINDHGGMWPRQNWRPLGSKIDGNFLFYAVAAGLGAFKEHGRTFHLTSIVFVLNNDGSKMADVLSSAGFSFVYMWNQLQSSN